ncbi:hypothetical protein LJC20_07570 [Eubacteriales bacterium OttesenSCG-928-M02]|nr:hypothetical protein [Eubacteriales bacterium OttesenSCG-928-M02]
MAQYQEKTFQGWKATEQSLLEREVAHVREHGLPLRLAFEAVAKKTGRKPNSVRNYYYAARKEGYLDIKENRVAFMPFTQAEIEQLVETVLSAQANGKSVRSITMEMGNQERKAMLRYQNKYRSTVKNYPELVRAIIHRMQAEGKPTFNPYEEERPHKSGRKPGGKSSRNVEDTLRQLAQSLSQLKGVDANGFLHQLNTLISLATANQDQSQIS